MALKTLLPLLSLYVGIVSCVPTGLPVIDLGYVSQRATLYNSTHDYYIFKNIRFAAPPLGDLRFRKPAPPLPEAEIQDGNITDTACVQTLPQQVTDIVGGDAITMGTEDCLLLDVYVPASVKATDKMPVFQWFYGGAYMIGSKEMWGDPMGLISAADEPMIYVASNYRLGAFGWLADAEQDIDMNVGLHDVRAAMDWVSKYISKFGGDPERITVAGESAGGGVIMHSITAYGGEHSPPPFKQAILQSAGMSPDKYAFAQRNNTYQGFLMAANCTSIECLREASTETLIASNEKILMSGVQITPSVDGDYVPDLPSRLLSQGKFHHVGSIIASNTWFESGLFLPSPDNVTSESFDGFVQSFFPNASASVISGLNELYPKGSDKISEYKRVTEFFQDTLFTCNAVSLARAFGEDAYRYIFNVSRAWHGDDVLYDFYNPGFELPGADINAWVAKVHQEYLVDFTVHGEPGCADTFPCFVEYSTSYGSGGNSLVISDDKVELLSADPWDNERCNFLVNVAWA